MARAQNFLDLEPLQQWGIGRGGHAPCGVFLAALLPSLANVLVGPMPTQ